MRLKLKHKYRQQAAFGMFIMVGVLASAAVVIVFLGVAEKNVIYDKAVLGFKTVADEPLAKPDKYRVALDKWAQEIEIAVSLADLFQDGDDFFFNSRVPGELQTAHLAKSIEYQKLKNIIQEEKTAMLKKILRAMARDISSLLD